VDRNNDCTHPQVGYSPLDALGLSQVSGADTARGMTKAMILHPIACGLNFIAFMLALGSGFVGSFLASMVALLAFVVTAVA
jgi:hypothetical protein